MEVHGFLHLQAIEDLAGVGIDWRSASRKGFVLSFSFPHGEHVSVLFTEGMSILALVFSFSVSLHAVELGCLPFKPEHRLALSIMLSFGWEAVVAATFEAADVA